MHSESGLYRCPAKGQRARRSGQGPIGLARQTRSGFDLPWQKWPEEKMSGSLREFQRYLSLLDRSLTGPPRSAKRLRCQLPSDSVPQTSH